MSACGWFSIRYTSFISVLLGIFNEIAPPRAFFDKHTTQIINRRKFHIAQLFREDEVSSILIWEFHGNWRTAYQKQIYVCGVRSGRRLISESTDWSKLIYFNIYLFIIKITGRIGGIDFCGRVRRRVKKIGRANTKGMQRAEITLLTLAHTRHNKIWLIASASCTIRVSKTFCGTQQRACTFLRVIKKGSCKAFSFLDVRRMRLRAPHARFLPVQPPAFRARCSDQLLVWALNGGRLTCMYVHISAAAAALCGKWAIWTLCSRAQPLAKYSHLLTEGLHAPLKATTETRDMHCGQSYGFTVRGNLALNHSTWEIHIYQIEVSLKRMQQH